MWRMKGGSYKIESTPKAWELYDLSTDPKELHNRYDDPNYKDVIDHLKARLLKLRSGIKETDDAYPHLATAIDQYRDK